MSRPGAIRLVPRYRDQGYRDEDLAQRRSWVEKMTGCRLTRVGNGSIPGEEMRGNIENPVGAVQMPLGIAGPLVIDGEHAQGTFYVPLATTEGALVRSYERGMLAITRSGGAAARVWIDENRVAPIFFFDSTAAAHHFAGRLDDVMDEIRRQAESTTRHGKLLRLESRPAGRKVIVNFCYYTGDAHGMNMIVKATEKACRWIQANTEAKSFYIFSGYNSEKRASGAILAGGKGKKVVAGAELKRDVVREVLHVTPDQVVDLWHQTVLGHLHAGALGYNGHYANGLAALFIACGQDVANLANSAVGVTDFEVTHDGDLHASVTLPSLTVATVGGGTALGTSAECLEMLGCRGRGQALKLAEITAATLLAGEISMAAAIASGEFVEAHEAYGRNRPSTT